MKQQPGIGTLLEKVSLNLDSLLFGWMVLPATVQSRKHRIRIRLSTWEIPAEFTGRHDGEGGVYFQSRVTTGV